MLTFNDFNRELQKRDIPKPIAIMLAHVYEAVIELHRQVDETTGVVLSLAEALEGFVALNEQTRKKLQRVERSGRPDGIDIYSERIEGDGE